MSLLNPEIQAQVRELFAGLDTPVKLLYFTQREGGALECELCVATGELVAEIAALSDRITLEVHDFVAGAELAAQYGVDKIPAIVPLQAGEQPKDFGIRFYGIPSGYEFTSLVEGIRLVSAGTPELRPETLDAVARLDRPAHLQVYITPTCPYCPRAVLLAFQLALASPLITADMVEATEFPHLANRYQVYGVPRTVINDVLHIEGAVPEQRLVPELMTVLDDKRMAGLRAQWHAGLERLAAAG
jgi:glutaredoxin-like protein